VLTLSESSPTGVKRVPANLVDQGRRFVDRDECHVWRFDSSCCRPAGQPFLRTPILCNRLDCGPFMRHYDNEATSFSTHERAHNQHLLTTSGHAPHIWPIRYHMAKTASTVCTNVWGAFFAGGLGRRSGPLRSYAKKGATGLVSRKVLAITCSQRGLASRL
jgi:hypothetical protein